MKILSLTYLSLFLWSSFCFAQKSNVKQKATQNKAAFSYNASAFSIKNTGTNSVGNGFEVGISKRINSESKKNRLSVGTDLGVSFQSSLNNTAYIQPNISYNIQVWKSFYFKPRVSLGTSIIRNNNEYLNDGSGVYKPVYSYQMRGGVGIEPNINLYKSKNYTYNFFTRFEVQNQGISKLLPITMWHVGVSVQNN